MKQTLPLLLLLALAWTAAAQSDIDRTTGSHRILPSAPTSARGTDAAFRRMNEEPVGLKYMLSPFFLSTDGAWLASATVGVIRPAALKTSLSFTYSYIDIDGGDQLDNLALGFKQELVAREGGGIVVLASYDETLDASSKIKVGGAGEIVLGGGFSTAGKVLWVRDDGTDVDDIAPTATVSWTHGRFTLGGEYTFENDVAGESDYAADVTIETPRGLNVLGAGKNDTVYANFVKIF